MVAYLNIEDDMQRKWVGVFRGKKAIILWIYDPIDRDAILLKNALARAETKDKTLIEITCSQTPSQLQLIRRAHHVQYGKYIEKDVEIDI